MMRRERGVTLLEKRHVARAADKTHVRHGMNESLRILDRALLRQVGPELPREIELGIDAQRL
jgi:hypothetical protein